MSVIEEMFLSLATVTVGYAAHRYLGGGRNVAPAFPKMPGALRVALFSGNYNCVRDGANQALNRLVGYLMEEAGASVRVYSPVAPVPAFAPAGNLVPVRSLAIPGRPEYRLATGLPASGRSDLARFGPNVVHLSAPDGLNFAAQRLARASGIPVVASLHTRFETYFDYYGLRLARPLGERWLRRFYSGCDRILVPTTACAEALGAWGLGERCQLWSRGVDHRLFSPERRDPEWRRRHGFGEEDIVPLFFGRLVHEKGLRTFVEIIERLRQRGLPVRPVIVGEGPARRWFVENLANATFTGHLSGEALARAVASTDLLINPSLTEAFGNVTLEAMAAGLPVICPNTGSTRDLVENGVTGLLVAPDADSHAEAAERLVRSPELARRMGSEARRASFRFDWATANRSVWDAYRELLAAPPARRSA